MIGPSNIQIVPDADRLGQSIAGALNTAATLQSRENELEMKRQEKLEELLTVATSGLADRDALELNKDLEGFHKQATEVAMKYQGRIPFNEYAKLNTVKANIEAKVKKSASDQQEARDVMKYASGAGSNYINRTATEKKIKEEFQKPVMERSSFWDVVVPKFNITQYIKKNINKTPSGGYVIENGGKTVRVDRSNNWESQMNAFMQNDEYRAAIEEEYQSRPENMAAYKSADEYNMATYGRFAMSETSNVKRNPAIISSSSGSKKAKKYTFKDDTYTFTANPITMTNLRDAAGRARTVRISRMKKNSNGTYTAYASEMNPYYAFDDLKKAHDAVSGNKPGVTEEMRRIAQLYSDKIEGATVEEKRKRYAEMQESAAWGAYTGEDFMNPKALATGTEITIELTDEDAAIVLSMLNSGYQRVDVESSGSSRSSSSGRGVDPLNLIP